MAREHDETQRRKRHWRHIIALVLWVGGRLSSLCTLGVIVGLPQRLVLVVFGLLLLIVLSRIYDSKVRRARTYVKPYCARVLRCPWVWVVPVMLVLVWGTLHLDRKLNCSNPLRTLDRTVRKQLTQDAEAAQESLRKLLSDSRGSVDVGLLANALLRYGLIDYERGLLPADNLHELLGLCRCISSKCSWPSWTKGSRSAVEKALANGPQPVLLDSDPNALFVLAGQAHGSQRTGIASELSAQLTNISGGTPFHIRLVPFSIPASADQTVYLETLAGCTQAAYFAVLGPSETIRFVAYKAEMQRFLLCPSPALEFPLSNIDWLKVHAYLREHALLLGAYDELMQGDYYEAIHVLEYLQEVISEDSVLGAESCLLKSFLHILCANRQKYLATQAEIGRWKANQAFPFVDLVTDIGAAFVSRRADPNELEPIWRKIKQQRNLLSADQRSAAEALAYIVDAHHHSRFAGCVDFLRSLRRIPNQSQWQQEQGHHIAEFVSKGWATGEERVQTSLKRALDIAATLGRDDLAVVAHVCAINATPDAKTIARHLGSISVLAKQPDLTFLWPTISFRLFPRFFVSHQEALSSDEWNQLAILLLQGADDYIGSASKYGTLGTHLRLIAALASIRTHLGPSVSPVVRDIILRLKPVSLDDWPRALPELMSMGALLIGDRATLAEQLKIWQDWAEIRATRREQTFEEHRDSAIILEITSLLALLNGNPSRALSYTESALEHLRVAKEGGYAKSPFLNFLLNEQAFILSLTLRQSALAAQYDIKAEKELVGLLSEEWNARSVDPNLLKLGQDLIPSVARLVQRTILERLKPNSWNVQGDPYFRQKDDLVRASCQEVTGALERYFVTQIKAQGLPEDRRAEQIAAVGTLFQVMGEACLASLSERGDRVPMGLSLRDMTHNLSRLTPGCGLPCEGPGRALRFIQLVVGNTVAACARRNGADATEETLHVLEPWQKKVALSITFDEDSRSSWGPAHIIGVAYKEMHCKLEELRAAHVTSTASFEVKALQVLAILPDTLDAIIGWLDKCFSGGMTDEELSERLLPGVLPEEAMSSSVALQLRLIRKLIGERMAAVEADPNFAQTVLDEMAAEVANLIGNHLQAVERFSQREPFDLLVAEQMCLLAYRGDFVAAAQAWERFDANAFPPADRAYTDTFKHIIYAHLLRKAGQLDPALNALGQLGHEQPWLNQCLQAIAASWRLEKGDVEQASQSLRMYFAGFDPARDTLRYHWRYRASAPVWDSGNSLQMTVGVNMDPAGLQLVVEPVISSAAQRAVSIGGLLASFARRRYNLPHDANAVQTLYAISDEDISFLKGSPEEIAFLRRHPDLLAKYGARYYNEPLHTVYYAADYGGFRNPWQCALLWAEIELSRGEPNAAGEAIQNLLWLYDHFGSYISTLNKTAQPAVSSIDGFMRPISSRERGEWLKSEEVQQDLARLLLIGARADVLGAQEASRTVFAIVRKRFVETGYADSVCATISKVDKARVNTLRCPSQQIEVRDAVRDWMWIIALSARETELDLSEPWVSSLTAEQDNDFRDTWAMFFADKLMEQHANLSDQEKQWNGRLAFAALLLEAVGDKNARYRQLADRLRQLRPTGFREN